MQPLILPDLYWALNFMHWPRGTINSIRLSACRQSDRLEAELNHGNEGLEDERRQGLLKHHGGNQRQS